jgi:hypothetical protein
VAARYPAGPARAAGGLPGRGLTRHRLGARRCRDRRGAREPRRAARPARLPGQDRSARGSHRSPPALRALPDAVVGRHVEPGAGRAATRAARGDAHARRRVERRVATRHRERRARLYRLVRPARAISRGLAQVLSRVGRAAGACVHRAGLSTLGQALAEHARVDPEDARSERQARAGGDRPVLCGGGDAGRPARDGIPRRPHARRPPDRAASNRAVSRGPDPDPIRGAGRPRAWRLRSPAPGTRGTSEPDRLRTVYESGARAPGSIVTP